MIMKTIKKIGESLRFTMNGARVFQLACGQKCPRSVIGEFPFRYYVMGWYYIISIGMLFLSSPKMAKTDDLHDQDHGTQVTAPRDADNHSGHDHDMPKNEAKENPSPADNDKHDDHKHVDHDSEKLEDHANHDDKDASKNEEKKPADGGHDDHDHDHGPGHDHKTHHKTHQKTEEPSSPKPKEKGHDDDHGDHDGHGHEEEEGGHMDEVTLTDEAIGLFELKIAPARRQNLERKISAPARVVFNTENMAHVGATVSGRVSEIKYRIGDSVRKGDVLLVLNSPELGMIQSGFFQKRSEIEVARVGMEVAESEYQRAKILVDGKGISQAEFLRIEGQYKIAKRALLTAESAAQSLENNLHLLGMSQERVEKLIASGEVDPVYSIAAAIDGEVIARQTTVGEVVSPDNDALMTVADLSVMWMVASVPEAQMRFVEIGARALLHSDGIGNDMVEGEVTYIAPALDERTRTGQVRIETKNENRRLRPGMFGRIQIFRKDENINNTMLAVPQSAVFTVEGDTAVFVVNPVEKNTFQKRRIMTGPLIDDYYPVLSGLREGEQVVVNGGFILKAELGKEGVAHEH